MRAKLTPSEKLSRAIRASYLTNERAIAEARIMNEQAKATGYELRLEYQIPDVANATMQQRAAARSGGRYRGPMLTKVVRGLSEKEARQRIRRLQRDPQVANPRIVKTWHEKEAARF